MPSSRLECHLHFASIRLCLALLFIISIQIYFQLRVKTLVGRDQRSTEVWFIIMPPKVKNNTLCKQTCRAGCRTKRAWELREIALKSTTIQIYFQLFVENLVGRDQQSTEVWFIIMPPKVKNNIVCLQTCRAGCRTKRAWELRERYSMEIYYYPDLLSALCQELGWPKVIGSKLSYT